MFRNVLKEIKDIHFLSGPSLLFFLISTILLAAFLILWIRLCQAGAGVVIGGLMKWL